MMMLMLLNDDDNDSVSTSLGWGFVAGTTIVCSTDEDWQPSNHTKNNEI